MSNRHREELLIAARRGAMEAMARERARVLWILDRLVQTSMKDLDSKVIPAAQLQLVKLRFELTRTICKAARTLVMSGVRPPEATATPAPGQAHKEPLSGQRIDSTIIDEPPAAPPSEVIVP